MLIGYINKAKLGQTGVVCLMVIQAALDHHPSINIHLSPQANLSHLCLTGEMKPASGNCQG